MSVSQSSSSPSSSSPPACATSRRCMCAGDGRSPALGGGSSPSSIVSCPGWPFQRPLLAAVSSGLGVNAFSSAFSPRRFNRNDIAACRESMYDSYLTISVRRYCDFFSQFVVAFWALDERGWYCSEASVCNL